MLVRRRERLDVPGQRASPTASSRSRRRTSRCARWSCAAAASTGRWSRFPPRSGSRRFRPRRPLPLLEAHHLGIEALPADFGGWGAVQLEAPDPAEVDAVIARGCVGISLPASALASSRRARAGRAAARPARSATTRRCSSTRVRSPDTGQAGGQRLAARLVARPDRLRRPDAGGLVRLPARRAPRASRACGCCSRCWPAAPRCSWSASPPAAARRPPRPTRWSSTTPPPTGRGCSRRWSARSASAQLVYGSDRPVVDAAAPPLDAALGRALLSTNPNRLLTPGQKGDVA